MGLLSSIGSIFSGGNVGSSIISAGASLFGGNKANKARRKEARRATAASALEASKNRDFQERLSNTAYQRQADDMEAAGLNRILSASTQGASTPVGATGTAFQAQNIQDTITPAVNTGFQAYNTTSQVELTQAKTSLTKVQETLQSNLEPGSESVAIIANQLNELLKSLLQDTGDTSSLYDEAKSVIKQGIAKAKELGGDAKQLTITITKGIRDLPQEIQDVIFSKHPNFNK